MAILKDSADRIIADGVSSTRSPLRNCVRESHTWADDAIVVVVPLGNEHDSVCDDLHKGIMQDMRPE